jgi:pimeloyl-ACP methyl ester carboxylesterase
MKTFSIQLKSDRHMTFKKYGSGKTVYLLLHGIPGSSHVWHKVACDLEKDDATIFVPDLLGFGQSSRPSSISDLWLEAQASALAESIEHLGLERIHLVGHDYGGPVSITLYQMIPQKIESLTILATNTFTDTPIPPPLAMIKLPLIGPLWEKAIFSKMSLGMMLRQGVGKNSQEIDVHSAIGDSSQTQSIGTIFSSALKELNSRYRNVQDFLSKIQVPTTVVWGTKDPFFSVKQGERTAAAIPGAKFVLIEGAGHFLPEERPLEIVSELKKRESI